MENWELKPCDDLNRMLKVRNDLTKLEKTNYPFLITLTHRYATSDDVLFPEAATLGFFAGFEEQCLEKLQDAIYVAQDIYTGLLEIHIYANNYEKTINDTIGYLKHKPEYHIEFKVITDNNWDIIQKLGE